MDDQNALLQDNTNGSGPIPGPISRPCPDVQPPARSARTVIDLDPHLIEAGGLSDRLYPDENDDDDAALVRSIAEYGQQVPVLVRPHPETAGRFQIVYGRRRVRAVRELGLPVKALIGDLDDMAVIMAQGQENTARRELSFIEKVVFVQTLDDAGYGRKVICDALSVDKTQISRMLSISEHIPFEVIGGIGPAHGVGRDRWAALADLIVGDPDCVYELPAMGHLLAAGPGSEDRFDAVIGYLRRNAARRAGGPKTVQDLAGPMRSKPSKARLRGTDGMTLGESVHGKDMVTLRFKRNRSRGFAEWLIASLPDIHRQWESEPFQPQSPVSPPP